MIKRRTFLAWSTAAPLLLSQTFMAHGASATPQNTLVMIDNLHNATDHDRVAIVIDAFVRSGLPVTCIVDPEPLHLGLLKPDSALCRMLRTRLQQTPGLLQVIPLVRKLGGMTPYFQARAVHDTRHALQAALWSPVDRPKHAAAGQTIACDMLPTTVAPSGV